MTRTMTARLATLLPTMLATLAGPVQDRESSLTKLVEDAPADRCDVALCS